MISLHPKFLRNQQGRKTAVELCIEEWDSILDELEELEDIRDMDKRSAEIEEFSMCRRHTPCIRKRR